MDKKAQGLSMNVIIIAAIALLVLVILSVLLIKSGGQLNSANKCTSIDGAQCLETCEGNLIPALGKECDDEGKKCCIPLGN